MTTETSFRRAADAPALPTGTLAFVLRALHAFRRPYAAMVFFEALSSGCAILMPYVLSRIIRTVTATPTPGASQWAALSGPLMLFVGLAVAEVVLGRIVGAIQIRTGPRIRQGVARALYHYLQHHSHRYMSNNFAGALAHRISETSMGTLQLLWIAATEFWPIFISLSVATVLLFRAHVELGLFSLGWSVAFIACAFWLARSCQPYAFKGAAARSETTGVMVDSITNSFSVRLFARMKHERENLDQRLEAEYRTIRVSSEYAERIRWFQFSAAAALKVGMLWFALRLWSTGHIAVGDFVMAVSLSLLLINEARNLARRLLEFFDHAGNVAHGVRTLVCEHELVDAPHAQARVITQGQIRFEDVSFGYTPGKPVFEHLSVEIPAGQRVGLVGLSGSGKSSFVSLLLRLYDVQAGTIRIDGMPITDLTQDALRSQIGLIPQDPSLFHRSLRENIRYGRPEAEDAEVIDAARKALADEFIQALPEGYEAFVGERGVKLSGGQRQRIAIARVILKDAPVLVLDEATSALDSLTEQAIQQALDKAMRGKTVIVVAHRLSTIAHLDRILVFDAGRIVEDGSHAELLASRGAYWRLWSRQAGGFLPQNSPSPEAAQADGADLPEPLSDNEDEPLPHPPA